MIPRRHSEGGSRRSSSILKPPKQRQPLQCVVLNPGSSSDTTPGTIKIKRRVSFAEKKHVKEFCDSFEQGTVWDNTYEENDSSHQKAIHSGNLDEGSTTFSAYQQSSIILVDKENYPLDIQVFQDHSQIAPVIPFCDDLQNQNEVLESSAMETDLDLPDVLIHTNTMQNSETNTPRNELASQEKNLRDSTALSEDNVSPAFYSEAPFQDTFYYNETMAFTKIVPSVPQNEKTDTYGHPNAEERTERIIHNLSMDFTEAVPNCIHLKEKELDDAQEDDMELTLEIENENVDISGEENGTKLNDMSMEMTTAIPSLPLEIHVVDNNYTRRNFSMEMTAAVPSIPIEGRRSHSDLIQIHRDGERTSFFRNSVKFTTAVPSCFDNQDAFQLNQLNARDVSVPRPKSMEFTSLVPSVLTTQNFPNVEQENFENRTILSRHKSMELTEIVPSSIPHHDVEIVNSEEQRTRFFCQKSMEFTAVVPSSLPVQQDFSSTDTGELTEKRRRLSRQSIFENCSHIGVEQRLRRSDGISLLNMEITEPLLCEPPSESLYPLQAETLSREGYSESINRASNIIQDNLREPHFQENTLIGGTSVSQVRVPPLSSSSIFLDKSKIDNYIGNPDLDEKNAQNMVSKFSEEIKDAVQEEEDVEESKNFDLRRNSSSQTSQFNSSVNRMKQIFNVSQGISIADPKDYKEEKEIGKVNTNLGSKSIFSNVESTSTGNSIKIKDRIDNFFVQDNSKILENEEPPSFYFDVSSNDEKSIPEITIDNEIEESKEVSRIGRKRSYEESGICEKENQVESLKTDLIQGMESKEKDWPKQITETDKSRRTFVINKENTNELPNSIEIDEVTRVIVESEKVKEKTETDKSRRTFVINKENTNELPNSIEIDEVTRVIVESEKVKEKTETDKSRRTFVINKENTNELPNSIEIDEVTRVIVESEKVKEKTETDKSRRTFVINKENTYELPNSIEIDEETRVIVESEKVKEKTETDKSRRTFVINKENTNELPNSIEIDEVTRIIVETEKAKEKTELRRTFVLEKQVPIADSNASSKIIQPIVESLEKANPILSHDLQHESKNWNKNRNSIENSINTSGNKTCETSANFNHTKDVNSKIKGYDRRYIFVINKEVNLNSEDAIQTSEETVPLEAENINEDNNFCDETGPIVENSSLILREAENIGKMECLQSEIHHESVTNINPSEGTILCSAREIGDYSMEKDDFEKQVPKTEKRNQNRVTDEAPKNDTEEPIEEEQMDSTIMKDPFCILVGNIRSYSQRDDCMWDVRYLNEKMLALDFISKSLVVIIKLSPQDEASFRDIKDIRIKSLLSGSTDDLICIVHDLITQKIHPELLLESHKLYADILPLLECISKEVKLALDFMFELQKLKDLNLMEINTKQISFVTRTKRMSIILEITLNIKPFEEISPDDIDVKCLLGSICINEVKQLIINIKRDHKFLSKFINDVRDYVELMEDLAAVGI